ncbi:Crp/Fnr family transcriptional regulator [Micromonospora sp. NPDC002389]|uniref:Crp/Fnr family transcriptional regulator n=1 Tax=Micromonospora sp. NPDC002389 TaxID=3154272 RepID=UPI00331D11FF
MATENLSAVPLFSMLDADRIERLAAQCPLREVLAGTVLARCGDPAGHLIVAERGTVVAGYDTRHGTRVRFATATGPCVVDKAATLHGGPHTATWTAVTRCRVRFLPADALRALIDEVPALRDHVLRHLSGQVNRDRRDRVRRAAPQPVARIADWIAEHRPAPGSRIHLPGAQQGLGEEVGLSRVTVNRALRVLVKAGAIRVEPGVVVVVDPRRLTASAAQR